ncbi:MAG: ADP-ribosylglycohydrolase family protein [Lewinella sp.]|uniref:ADP-ribosylglycohydrolase family protein n=1 Tax=Lewinella sp. TaxID=2004506 RepID=UPI003D6C0139
MPPRRLLAKKSLLGTSIGDAFGESFFGETQKMKEAIFQCEVPDSTWEFTDDTVMSISVFKQLVNNGKINQTELALEFVRNHDLDPNRGYGATARRILREIGIGKSWKAASRGAFDGMGSMGNGAAMRASVIGAYFYDDIEKVIEEASKSAEVTHSNKEGICGAIGVALASMYSTRIGKEQESLSPKEFIAKIGENTPDSDTKYSILKGLSLSSSAHPEMLRSVLGDGTKMKSQDTVPYSIWCAAHYSTSFENALWKAVSILGDRDTICAIVGGIVIMSAPEETIPLDWVNSVERVEDSIFY